MLVQTNFISTTTPCGGGTHPSEYLVMYKPYNCFLWKMLDLYLVRSNAIQQVYKKLSATGQVIK